MTADTASSADQMRRILVEVLGVPPATAAGLDDASPLFGALPEIDSMAVAGLLTEMEDRFGIVIDDDEVDADLFATFGNLVEFVARKAQA
ncbi:acyl carrier protein [Sphingosinicella soli]|uniref:Acyl carrier protein n=1 Tax=Sphingosinicella soli TaxID=333708 RepID=A0A7W7AYE6_9SPHN|nr:acyl carrier protein [Sphingosinicella soli]MBB4630671.1 acyl carrier protein [Sphingosinicella soli]